MRVETDTETAVTLESGAGTETVTVSPDDGMATVTLCGRGHPVVGRDGDALGAGAALHVTAVSVSVSARTANGSVVVDARLVDVQRHRGDVLQRQLDGVLRRRRRAPPTAPPRCPPGPPPTVPAK